MDKDLKDVKESHDFNRAALAKQRLMNLKGKRIRGAAIANLMRAAGLREEEITDEDITQLDEVLSKDAAAEKWIHDFVHSTNPKFDGKSKKERIRMALGAYYSKHPELHKENAPVAPVLDRKYIKGTPEWKAHKEKNKSRVGHPTNEELELEENHLLSYRRYTQAAKNFKQKGDHDLAKDAEQKAAKAGENYKRITGKSPTFHEGVEIEQNLGENKMDLGESKMGQLASDLESLSHKEFTNIYKKPKTYFSNLSKSIKKKSKEQSVSEEFELEEAARYTFKSWVVAESFNEYSILESSYAGLEKEPKKGLKSGAIKMSNKAVESDTVEGWDHPSKAVKKESYEDQSKKSYTQFMSDLLEYTELLEYDSVAGRYVHKGSYGYSGKGSAFGQTDYDKETLDSKDETGTQPVKRGRGRPAGSKSGARGPRIK